MIEPRGDLALDAVVDLLEEIEIGDEAAVLDREGVEVEEHPGGTEGPMDPGPVPEGLRVSAAAEDDAGAVEHGGERRGGHDAHLEPAELPQQVRLFAQEGGGLLHFL